MRGRHLHLIVTRALAVLPLLHAQTAFAQAPPQSGPLVIQRMDNQFVLAPEVEVSDVDGRTGTLAGGYAGWLVDGALLVGGGGYWLADGTDGVRLGCGGLVVGWTIHTASPIRFGVKSLIGAGTATIGIDLDHGAPIARFGSRATDTVRGAPSPARNTLVRGDFLLAEPQATLQVRVLRSVGLSVGIGYRFTGAAGALDDRLNGLTGSLAVQIGGW